MGDPASDTDSLGTGSKLSESVTVIVAFEVDVPSAVRDDGLRLSLKFAWPAPDAPAAGEIETTQAAIAPSANSVLRATCWPEARRP